MRASSAEITGVPARGGSFFCEPAEFSCARAGMERRIKKDRIDIRSIPPRAQENSAGSQKKDPPLAGTPVISAEEARMKTLEDQVRTLAEQVTLLRGELKAMRDTRSAEPRSEEPILLAASPVAPGILSPSAPAAVPASPEPAPPQATQTQIFGGASSNAKLLNPDISLIGDFIGTAGRNTVSPSRALELH